MLVPIALDSGEEIYINPDQIRSMRHKNVAAEDAQPQFITTITFVDGKNEKVAGTTREVRHHLKTEGWGR